jgi:ribonuclease Z
MRPNFHPRPVNGPFDDPCLFIPLSYENRAIMFDLGDIHALSSRDILKVTHVFVTHTHMDHFAGFDRLLRLVLGREKELHLFGPKGFIKNVEGKLAGYSWNLVKNYHHPLSLHIVEVHPDHLSANRYLCRNEFTPRTPPERLPFDGFLLTEPAFSVSAIILDHRIPCLAYSIKESFHINIRKEALSKLGLSTGPWLNDFKQALYQNRSPHSPFYIENGPDGSGQNYPLGELADQIAIITPGQKIVYIADTVYSAEMSNKIISFAENADQLFIEAAFLEKDKEIAAEKYHLTAYQAGRIAAMANVKNFTLFHFSPRYSGQEALFHQEARRAYQLATAYQSIVG